MRILHTFWSALGFLTILPAGGGRMLEKEEFGRFPAFYPAVGLVLGFLLFLFWSIGRTFLPTSVNAVLLVTALVVLSRGFHLDGLADAADALLSHKSLEQKLLIMKDSRQGTFGVLSIVLDIMLKVQLLQIVLANSPYLLILWPMWGRLCASVVAALSKYVRVEGGLGQWMVDLSGKREMTQALLFSLFISVFFGAHALIACLFVFIFGFFLTWLWKKCLNGITGDLLGASIELCEIFVLLLCCFLTTKTANITLFDCYLFFK